MVPHPEYLVLHPPNILIKTHHPFYTPHFSHNNNHPTSPNSHHHHQRTRTEISTQTEKCHKKAQWAEVVHLQADPNWMTPGKGQKLILLNRKEMPLAGIANIRGLRVRPQPASSHITQAIVDDILQAIHNTGTLDSPAISSSEESVHLVPRETRKRVMITSTGRNPVLMRSQYCSLF